MKYFENILYPAAVVEAEYFSTPFSDVYIERMGNSSGKKVIYVHGGPGSGLDELYYRFFDLDLYQVIGYEQGGCNRSKIKRGIQVTSQLLVEELEYIRNYFAKEEIILFGSSWGSTLSLLYAIKYPKRCQELILHGFWLGTKKDIEWMFSATNEQKYIALERLGYLDGFLEACKEKRNSIEMAKLYIGYLSSINTVHAEFSIPKRITKLEFRRFQSQINFFSNNLFLENDFIESRISEINHLSITSVHGWQDSVCDPNRLFEISKLHKNIEVEFCSGAGHSKYEINSAIKLLEILQRKK